MRLFIIFCSIVDICCFCVYTLQLLPIAVRPYEADVVYTGDRGQSFRGRETAVGAGVGRTSVVVCPPSPQSCGL